jgi:hypothetical protein
LLLYYLRKMTAGVAEGECGCGGIGCEKVV